MRRSFPCTRLPRPASIAKTVTVKNGPLCSAEFRHCLFGLTFAPLRLEGGESQPLSPRLFSTFTRPLCLSAEPKLLRRFEPRRAFEQFFHAGVFLWFRRD